MTNRTVKETEHNAKLKEYARKHDVRLWELSARLGYKTDGTLCRKLRYPLDKETEKYYRLLIDEIAMAKKAK